MKEIEETYKWLCKYIELIDTQPKTIKTDLSELRQSMVETKDECEKAIKAYYGEYYNIIKDVR